jgi:hypothetical protein
VWQEPKLLKLPVWPFFHAYNFLSFLTLYSSFSQIPLLLYICIFMAWCFLSMHHNFLPLSLAGMQYTVLCPITMFQSLKDHIYYKGPIITMKMNNSYCLIFLLCPFYVYVCLHIQILNIALQLPPVLSTVICCTGL